jgi:hypothetical protein
LPTTWAVFFVVLFCWCCLLRQGFTK